MDLKSLMSKELLEIIGDFVVGTVPADGLAPLGARPSAGTMMTKCRWCRYMKLSLEELTNVTMINDELLGHWKVIYQSINLWSVHKRSKNFYFYNKNTL